MRFVGAALAAVLIGLALFEVTMQPSLEERLDLAVIFLAMAFVMVVIGRFLPRLAKKNPSIRTTVAALSMTSLLLVAGGALAVANRMFISQHDLTLLLVVLAFGVAAALGFALAVGRPLTEDIDRLSEGATRVADGELGMPVGLDRRDEIGQLGDAIDQMIGRLDEMEEQRQLDSEARRAFFAAVGHDLRTPLSSLRAAIEAMQDGLVGDTDKFLASMEKDTSALSELVNDIFLLARLDAGAHDLVRVEVDLRESVDEAIEVLTPVAETRGVALRPVTTQDVTVIADDGALGRVLRNVIENAIRHAPDESEVSILATVDGEFVTVRVSDEGGGFSDGFVSVAFDRFTREDPARGRGTGGSGLGLAIANGFILALDGEIWAEPGPGGCVSFRLPRPTVSRPESSVPVPSGTAPAARREPRR